MTPACASLVAQYYGKIFEKVVQVSSPSAAELCKLRAGRGGVWRIPPSFDGSSRRPLPRFTVLTEHDLQTMSDFFLEWGEKTRRI